MSGAIGDLTWCASNTGIESGWSNASASFALGTNQPPSGAPTITPTVTSASGSNITYLSVDRWAGIYQAASFTSSDSTQPLVVTGHATLYVTGDFTIQGSGYIDIVPGASLTLYVGGKTVISGNGLVNANGRPEAFRYIGLSGNKTVTYTGLSALYGTINAPQADVTMSGSAGICGAVVCNTYSGSGSSSVHYDVSLSLAVITAPANLVLECPADTTTNATGVAVAQGGCSDLTIGYSDAVTNNCGGSKVITRTWTASDACGDSASAVQTITVQDTTPPVVSAPANVVLPFNGDIGTNSTGVAAVHDGCSAVAVQYSDAVTVNADGSQVIARTWTAADACGNAASAVQLISLTAPSALILPKQPNIALTNSESLIVGQTATNPNGSTSPLLYQLVNPPAGATIDSNGIITWTPTPGQSPSTNLVVVVVSTTVTSSAGNSTISSSNSFLVTVSSPYDGLDLGVDTDGDGLTNLVEYAVGSDPKNSADGSSDIIIWITNESGNRYLAMQFKRRVNAAALQLEYRPQVSADKSTWASDSANLVQLSVTAFDSEYDWVTVRDMTPITPGAARFIRLDIISAALESASPTWIGTATPLAGNSGNGTKFNTFSQRMVLPILYAGTVSSLQNSALTDANAAWSNAQFGSTNAPAYAEFDNGYMVDIAGTASSQSLSLAGSISGLVSTGDNYRVRQHFTIASLFGTNNETGLKAGLNPTQADTILVVIPQTQQTMTIFYFSNEVAQGWYRADYSPAADQVIYPEQGVMVRRVVPGNVNLYVCGPVKLGATIVPVEPGFNSVGTLKSLSTMTLSSLNLYTGDPSTGIASGLNLTVSDAVLVVEPSGATASYFYFKNSQGQEGWLDSLFNPAGSTAIPAGSAFFIKRQPAHGSFEWTIPAE